MGTINVNPAYWEHAQRCSDFRKLPADFRRMFAVAAKGDDVDIVDMENGLMLAMRCAATCAGQSAARTAACETVLALFYSVFNGGRPLNTTRVEYRISVKGIGTAAVGANAAPVDDPVRLEAWLSR